MLCDDMKCNMRISKTAASVDETDGIDNTFALSRFINNLPDQGITTRSKQAEQLTNDLKTERKSNEPFDQFSTSDYSSNSSISITLQNSIDSSSGLSSTPSVKGEIENDSQMRLSPSDGWESDSSTQEDLPWGSKADFAYFDSQRPMILKYEDVHLIHHVRQTLDVSLSKVAVNLDTKPKTNLRTHHVSPIVQIHPQGCQQDTPSRLYIPLDIKPINPEWLQVLYSPSNSHSLDWRPVEKDCFRYCYPYIVVYTSVFAVYTVTYEEPFPVIRKRMCRRYGGRVELAESKGFKVHFPRGSCSGDVDCSLTILYDHDECTNKEPEKFALACPIIRLGPHGYKVDRKAVEIELPVPHYKEIKSKFPDANLLIYQSNTSENPLYWEPLDVDRQSIHEYRHNNLISFSFPVHHFSFFKVVWDILADNLYKAKMGVSYFYPWISFPMKCQAYMEESDKHNFGLEVICFNSERNPEQVQTSNYRHCVGSNLKPVLVKPGKISVQLRSGKFRADVEAGEDEEMLKEESDFRGRDFDKQFSCIFIEEKVVERGPFGKVIVTRNPGLVDKEELFNFNLNKTGKETENPITEKSDRWSVVAVKELAGHLNISRDVDRVSSFARYIGFTGQEIRSRIHPAPDPFMTMMALYQERGGTPEEFVQALYAVSRDVNLAGDGSTGSGGTPNSSSSGVSGSAGSQGSKNQSGAGDLSAFSKRFSFFGLNTWKKRDDSDSGTADMQGDPSPRGSAEVDGPLGRKRGRGGRERGGPLQPSKKRKVQPSSSHKRSYQNTDSETSSDESGPEEKTKFARPGSPSTAYYKNDQRKLTDQDLWLISASMNAINWRALGRTLGLEESVLLNLEHAHKGAGFRECAYQMLLEWKGTKPKQCAFGSLYTALCEEKMNGVAKHMAGLFSQQKKES